MMKATLRSAVLLGLLATSLPAFAEVQNVKISGDVTVRSFLRKNLDLHDERGAATDTSGAGSTRLDGETFFTTTTGLNVGADLTENVSAFVRVANERDWNNVSSTAAGDVDISQAYVTLKELFYSPLTVRIGTQPITWGRGFVLGSSLIPGIILAGDDRNASFTPNEFTDFTAFDAIRATWDLSNVGGMNMPLMLDTVYIKVDENNPSIADDVNLMGFNLGTKFDGMNSEAELYYLNKRDRSRNATTDHNGSVSTLGIRGSAKPVESSFVWGELAYQFGQNAVDPGGVNAAATLGDAHQAWAFDLGLEYTFANVATTPTLGWEWEYWSGKDSDGGISGWDPIARSYFTTAIREFQTGGATGFYGTDQAGDTGANTNQSQMGWYVKLKPVEDLTVTPRLTFFWEDVGAVPFTRAGTEDTLGRVNGDRRHFAGTEWDTVVNYNYTDDVQFGVIYALFSPGSIYRTPNDSAAQELITSVGVKF